MTTPATMPACYSAVEGAQPGIIATVELHHSPGHDRPCRANFDGSNAIKITDIDAPDASHVVFQLASRSSALLSAMARSDCDSTGIAHPDAVAQDGTWTKAIGTGPFQLSDWRKGQFVELSRFDGYRSRNEPPDGLSGAKPVHVDKVRLDLVPDPQAAKLALLQGRIDLWFEVEPSQVSELETNKTVRLLTSPLASIYTLPFQTRDPVLSDPRIRRAISSAIDRKALSDALTEGKAQASGSLVPVISRHYGAVERTGAEFDPIKARALLTEAGYNGDRIVLLTNKQNAIMADTAIYVQAMLRAVGLNVDVEVLEFATQFERYYSGKYQMMVWNLAPYLDPLFIIERFTGDKARQADKVWDDPKAISILQSLFGPDDGADRQRSFDELHRLFLADMPLVVWGTRVSTAAVGRALSGYEAWAGQKPRFWGLSLQR